MAQYKIVINYQVLDIQPNPDVTVAPNPDLPNASYSGTFDTAEQVKAFIIANAVARVALVTPVVATAQAVLTSINPPAP